MNEPIDVLAVLDDAIPVYGSRFTHADFDQTRAAMVELIESSRVIDAEFRSDPMAVQCFDLGVLRRWQAALARVGGAK